MRLKISDIRIDGNTQSRVAISQETINEYAEAMKDGDVFPPVTVFKSQQGEYWLADGYHRLYAAKQSGASEIEADVKDGDVYSAMEYAAGANAKHGIRRTNADKRRAVLMLLECPKYRNASDRLIAEVARVSHGFVSCIRESNGYQRECNQVISPQGELAKVRRELAEIKAVMKNRKEKTLVKAKEAGADVPIVQQKMNQLSHSINNARYYVYVWKRKKDGVIVYVGKGKNSRALDVHANTEAQRIRDTEDIEITIVKEHLTEDEALNLETELIHKEVKNGNTSLTNKQKTGIGKNRTRGNATYIPPLIAEMPVSVFMAYQGIHYTSFDSIREYYSKVMWNVVETHGGSKMREILEFEQVYQRNFSYVDLSAIHEEYLSGFLHELPLRKEVSVTQYMHGLLSTYLKQALVPECALTRIIGGRERLQDFHCLSLGLLLLEEIALGVGFFGLFRFCTRFVCESLNNGNKYLEKGYELSNYSHWL